MGTTALQTRKPLQIDGKTLSQLSSVTVDRALVAGDPAGVIDQDIDLAKFADDLITISTALLEISALMAGSGVPAP